MRLIVTEKNNSAKKIAEILSGGQAKGDAVYKVPFYTWSDSDGEQTAIGLKGHVVNPAFPDDYSNWQQTDLHDLIDAKLTREPTDKNVLRAVRKVAKEATDVVIATDYDREGELIGLEALTEVLEVNPAIAGNGDGSPDGDAAQLVASRPRVKRARYSALTKDEIERAFSNLDDLSYDLADAGAARQDIDLIWGATLTRAVSLATRRFGSNFLSVGRVQSPTLGLIVERELERRAHVPEPYWEVFARFQHPDGAFEAHHSTDRFWEKAEADAALAGTKSPGKVKEVSAQALAAEAPGSLQHHGVHDRGLESPRDHAEARHAARRGPLHGRLHLLSAHRQHGLSGLASHPRAGRLAGPHPRVRGRRLSAGGRPEADARKEGDHRPSADLPDPGCPSGGARRPQATRVRAGRSALPGHLRAADGDRVDPRRHRGGIGELLRARLGGHRPRLRRHLHLRSLRATRRSPSSPRARSWRSTASPGRWTRRPSRRRGSARASWSS